MTGGSPQTDPRDDAEFRPWDAALPSDAAVVAAVKALLHGPGEWIGDGLQIAQLGQRIVAAVHAADEASGVRRVTAQELAAERQMREALQHLADRGLSADLTPTMNCRDTGTLYAGFSDYLQRLDAHVRDVAKRALSAADSPVGGVS